MTGRPDYDAGDLVVCVDAGTIRCSVGMHNAGNLNGKPGSVTIVRGFYVGRVFPDGKRCSCHCVVTDDNPDGVLAARFRRIDPKPPEFWTGTVDADAGDQVPA